MESGPSPGSLEVIQCRFELVSRSGVNRTLPPLTHPLTPRIFRSSLIVQELFSSFASFLNGVPHAVYLFTPSLRAKYAGPKGHYMRIPLYVHSAVAMNSWLWSTIFHARDIPFTEAADYFFATMQLMFSMWMAIYRMSRRSPPIEDEGKAAEGSEKEGQPRRRRNDAVVGFLGSHG